MSIEIENAIEVLTDEVRSLANVTSGIEYWRRVFVAAALTGLVASDKGESSYESVAKVALKHADAILAALEARK